MKPIRPAEEAPEAPLPPTRGHGLKLRDLILLPSCGKLPPTRGHGLKLFGDGRVRIGP